MSKRMSVPCGPMPRRAVLGLLGAGVLGSAAGPAIAASRVGQVAAIDGRGFAGEAPARRLRRAASLLLGDKVWTEAASHASLALDLGATVHLGPESQLVLDRFVAASRGVMTLGAGAMVFDRDDALPDLDIRIRTTFAQIGLRGTRFYAGHEGDGFAVFVARGSVRVAAGGRVAILNAGDGVDIPAPGVRPSPVTRWQPTRIADALARVLP